MRTLVWKSLVLLTAVATIGCADEKKTVKKQDAPEGLAIGKVAPDIVGEDIDGQSFKLSDYRGKVVVLDFWGNW